MSVIVSATTKKSNKRVRPITLRSDYGYLRKV